MTIKPNKPAPYLLHHSQMLPLLPTKNIMTHPEKALYSTTNSKPKMMTLHLPHPCSLNILPSPTNKWSAITHPVKGCLFGYLSYHIFYKPFFFPRCWCPPHKCVRSQHHCHQSSTTKLGTGDNCAMSQDDCVLFAIILVLVGLLAWENAWYTMQQWFICQYAPHRFCFSHQSHHCLHPQQEALQSRCTASAP